ncbi:bacteriocin family protein [Christensenellaceae bacterium OttesenSCG-928-K19]|nr:bacteriocin family protein [Christensenellaceae bacterium OttesenSCG-928-K19]
MDYLSRESAPYSEELWKSIDTAVVDTAKRILVGRRFLSLFGPLGPGVTTLNVDTAKEEKFDNGIVRTSGRNYLEVPQLYNDFWLLWRDIENSEKEGYPIDLSAAMSSAETVARLEDRLIFFGDKELGIQGLTNAAGVNKIKRGDWGTGEAAYQDIAKGLTLLNEKGYYGRYAIIMSPDIYLSLQRIQQGTGVMEIDRVEKMVDGRVFHTTALGMKKALLVCCEPQYMDLAVGQDLAVAYLELADLNHHLRVMETALPRLKSPEAVVSFD